MSKLDAPKSLYLGDRFLTYTEVIATFEDTWSDQQLFMSEAYHNKDCSPQEIEMNVATRAVEYLLTRCPVEMTRLVKLSTCITRTEEYKPEELKKIKLYGAVSLGKFYFQPDQLCDVTFHIRSKYPIVASKTMSYRDFEHLNRE